MRFRTRALATLSEAQSVACRLHLQPGTRSKIRCVYIHCIITRTARSQSHRTCHQPRAFLNSLCVVCILTRWEPATPRGGARAPRAATATVPASECSYRARMLLGAQPTCSKQFGAVGQPAFLTSMFLEVKSICSG